MSKIVKVRIRQWDDMVKEFGYTDYSYHRDIINCLACFTKDMEFLYGKTIEIIAISIEGKFNSLILHNPDIASCFTITIDMVEKEDRGKLVGLQFKQKSNK